jgi:uncharacterized protein (TIGR03437 family)
MISANVAATNNAAIGNNTVGLIVTDEGGLTATANLIVTVTQMNTMTGSNVTVAGNGVALIFSNVMTAGNTSITEIDPSAVGPLLSGYSAGGVAFNVSTTAVFSGPIVITFDVPGITDPTIFSTLRILHGEGTPSALIDRTILPPDSPAPDFANKKISARVTSLSPFVLAKIDLSALTYEADVAPRPNGNGSVTISDWVQVGRFAAGLDTPSAGNEFQRADSAPRASFGDGKITVSDWVQAGRYAAGLDGTAFAAGPTTFIAAAQPTAHTPEIEGTRLLSVRNEIFQRGQLNSLPIEIAAQGNENAAAFSLNFDPKQLTFVDAVVSNGAALQVNQSQAANGRLGVALALPAGQQIAAGTRSLLTLRFIPNGGEGDVITNINFSDQLLKREVVDVFAAPLAAVNYTGGSVTIRGRAAANVSAASYVVAELAAEAIASAFGAGLATMTAGAVSMPLPHTLGGTSVKVKDALGVERIAPLFFVSPNQINYQIPAATAEGIAVVTITNSLGEVTSGILRIARVAPGLFTAEASGKGWAAAEVVTVAGDGSQTVSPVARFDQSQNKILPVPIDVSAHLTVLVLYGTGIRQRGDLAEVKVKVGGVEAAVEFAGAQANYSGLDQINVRLPKSLLGRGEVEVELMIAEKVANRVKVFCQ